MSIIERAIGKLASQAIHTPQAPVQPRQSAAPLAAPRGKELRAGGGRIELDTERLVERGVMPQRRHAARISENYRSIKRPLLRNALGEQRETLPNANLIMIASALPGDGKSFTALNLALAIAAEPDRSVVLVDADVARGKLSECLGVREERGLLDVLRDEQLALTDVLLETNVPGLTVLSAGPKSDLATELFGTDRMAQVWSEFAATYPHCIVVFDSSPLLATNEAQILAGIAGQIVFVVKADGTPVPAVDEALAMLDRSKSINIVLNQAQALFGQEYKYGSYY